MKAALYLENTLHQIILTPENDVERDLLKLVSAKGVELTTNIGSSGMCRGGWVRYYTLSNGAFSNKVELASLKLTLKSGEGEE